VHLFLPSHDRPKPSPCPSLLPPKMSLRRIEDRSLLLSIVVACLVRSLPVYSVAKNGRRLTLSCAYLHPPFPLRTPQPGAPLPAPRTNSATSKPTLLNHFSSNRPFCACTTIALASFLTSTPPPSDGAPRPRPSSSPRPVALT